MTIAFRVNGVEERFDCSPGDMLADLLRSAGHVEVKKGCGTGNCGACTVLLDGKPILSCSFLALRAEGREVTTVRGIEDEAAAYAAFVTAEGADQCGFCGPGLALAVHALKSEKRHPSEEEIRSYLAGNLCRCSGYAGQLRAIAKYLEAADAE